MVLIIKYAGIGDLVMALPSYLFLCEKHGRENVFWMVDKKLSSFIEIFVPRENLVYLDFDALHRSFLSKFLLIFSINFLVVKGRYKKIYLLHSNIRYRIFLLTSLWKNQNYCYKFLGRQAIVGGRYSGLNFFSMVTESDGPDLDKFNIYFKKIKTLIKNLTDSYKGSFANAINLNEKYIVCSPGYGGNIGDQSSQRRKLGLDKWEGVIKKCKGLGYRVVLTGAPSEIEDLSSICHLVDYNLVGKSSFVDLFYLMDKSCGVVCTDNGQFHLATIVGCKVLSIFGPTNFFERVPPANENIFQLNRKLPLCAPCHDGRLVFECKVNVCMTNFNVDSLEEYL